MLKGINPVLSPELLKALCEMGHGDELVIADGNFPCESVGKNAIVVRADGHSTTEILDAVLSLIPLDIPKNLLHLWRLLRATIRPLPKFGKNMMLFSRNMSRSTMM